MNSTQANKTVAVIDVGSNSIKLLVARKGSENSPLEKLFSKTHETRISTGIGKRTLKLSNEAMAAGCESITDLVRIAKDYNSNIVKIVATSAVRDASNGLEFVEKVKQATGIELSILPGIEEATFIGKGLRCDPLLAETDRFIQIDIGGGSLELTRINKESIEKACSLQLGAVRMTEKFLSDHMQTVDSETEAKIRDHTLKSVAESGFSFEPVTDPMIVTGGAFSVIRSILNARADENPRDTSQVLYRKDITQLKETLCNLSLDERKALPGLPSARADIMPAALITIDTVLELSGRAIVTQSFYNLRYGIAAALLEEV